MNGQYRSWLTQCYCWLFFFQRLKFCFDACYFLFWDERSRLEAISFPFRTFRAVLRGLHSCSWIPPSGLLLLVRLTNTEVGLSCIFLAGSTVVSVTDHGRVCFESSGVWLFVIWLLSNGATLCLYSARNRYSFYVSCLSHVVPSRVDDDLYRNDTSAVWMSVLAPVVWETLLLESSDCARSARTQACSRSCAVCCTRNGCTIKVMDPLSEQIFEK